MLCQKLWRDIWSDPNAQLNGRKGQPQHGVDVFGHPIYQANYAGVQCKDKDSRLGSELTAGELDEECTKATQFIPPIESFSMATTAARDGALQEYARRLTESQSYPFGVSVWSWDDIAEEVSYRPTILQAYYPTFQASVQDASKVSISLFAYREQFNAFFSRPQIRQRIAPKLGQFIVPLSYELSDNAYRHGKASIFKIACSDESITFEDDGMPFDPLKGLDASKASAESHIGSLILEGFVREFKDDMQISYASINEDGKSLNRLTVQFSESIATLGGTEIMEFPVDMSLIFGREAAEQLAASIPLPNEVRELVLVVTQVHNVSALAELIMCMLGRLKPEMRLTVSLPRIPQLHFFERLFKGYFGDDRLSILYR